MCAGRGQEFRKKRVGSVNNPKQTFLLWCRSLPRALKRMRMEALIGSVEALRYPKGNPLLTSAEWSSRMVPVSALPHCPGQSD
jgi:hypothetical protein